MVVIVYTEPQAYGDEGRVTTILHTLHKSLASVSGDLMAADLTVIHNDKSRTGKGALRRDNSRLQACGGGNDLEGGSRLVGIIDTAVAPHGIEFLLLLLRSQGGWIYGHNASVFLHFSLLRQGIWVV